MCMNIDKEMEELFVLLDNNDDIKKIQIIKDKITKKEISLINNYRNNPTVANKKELYSNPVIDEYLKTESNINYLIMQINNKFKGRGICPK